MLLKKKYSKVVYYLQIEREIYVSVRFHLPKKLMFIFK